MRKSYYLWQHGPWRHYAKGNKSKKRQMLYDMTYLWNLKNKNQSVQKEIRFMVTRDGR